MNKEATRMMGTYLWQNRCYLCGVDGLVCQAVSYKNPKTTLKEDMDKGVWRIFFVGEEISIYNPKAKIETCARRVSILATAAKELAMV